MTTHQGEDGDPAAAAMLQQRSRPSPATIRLARYHEGQANSATPMSDQLTSRPEPIAECERREDVTAVVSALSGSKRVMERCWSPAAAFAHEDRSRNRDLLQEALRLQVIGSRPTLRRLAAHLDAGIEALQRRRGRGIAKIGFRISAIFGFSLRTASRMIGAGA